jgi:hypothetical protein
MEEDSANSSRRMWRKSFYGTSFRGLSIAVVKKSLDINGPVLYKTEIMQVLFLYNIYQLSHHHQFLTYIFTGHRASMLLLQQQHSQIRVVILYTYDNVCDNG